MVEVPNDLNVHLSQDAPIPLDAQLSCAPGEVLALVGPSGSGKSTILRAIAGLNHIAKGHISCNGRIWYDTEKKIDVATRHRRVGYVFQSYALFPHLSALANIMEALASQPFDKREARARELLELVRLSGLEMRRPSELSGGQQQRVAVARALARDPDVLLLDEPFSAVDRATRQRLHLELGQLRSQLNMPVVLVTHDLEEAAQLSDRMSILHRGQILQEGPPYEIMARPASRAVARLIDLKNIFRARIAGHDRHKKITFLDWDGLKLEAEFNGQFAVGVFVDWVVSSGSVILHRRRGPSRGVRENPVHGTIANIVRLGEMVTVAINLEGHSKHPMFMSISAHAASRNAIVPGDRVGVSLRSDDIHLMAPHEVDELG